MSRILVIDADPGERLIVKSRISDLGHEVIAAENGAQGLTEARGGEFEAILLAADLGKGVDAAEVCRRMKAVPELQSTPIVFYATQPTTPESFERAYDAGCETFISKAMLPTMDRVLEVLLRAKRRQDELVEEAKVLASAGRKLEEERARRFDAAATLDRATQSTLVVQEMAAGHPDGVLIVDSRGRVRSMDRGSCELLGMRAEGKNLGALAPGSGFEAFVRDARTEAREGFRFDLGPRRGRPGRSLLASVVPIHSGGGADQDEDLRIVLLLDVGRRRVAEEMVRAQEPGIPRHQLSTLLEAARAMFSPESLSGRSDATSRLRRRVIELARQRGPVLIRGERGSGKEFVARVLHYSGTATGPFLQVRCSALSAESLENELFGYAEGAFPGAVADRPGLLSLAQDGSLYLGEIQELPLELQARLVLAIEKGIVRRRGARADERIDVRIFASSSQDLHALAEQGRLDTRLLSRLAATAVDVPTLRERIDDVPAIAGTFLDRFGARRGVETITEDALWVMQQYDWPGNIGELEDCVEQACTRADDSTVEVEHLSRPLRDLHEELPDRDLIPAIRPPRPTETQLGGGGGAIYGGAAPTRSEYSPVAVAAKLRPWDITDEDPISLDHYEKKVLLRALHSCNGDKLKAAKLLKVGKSTLYRKLKRFDIK